VKSPRFLNALLTQANWSPYNVTYLFYGGFSRCTGRASLLIGGF
jgi:hypothetical protein